MVKAERELDDAKAELAHLKAAKASKEDIQRALDDVVRIDKRFLATIEAHKAAMAAEAAAFAATRGGGQGARGCRFRSSPTFWRVSSAR